MRNVDDVTDARESVTKGKVPRNIIVSVGAVAAVLIGGLGFYYQSQTDEDSQKIVEAQKAAKLRESTAAPTNAATLQQTILKQQQEAREEANRQGASAVQADPPSAAPVLTAKDFTVSGALTSGKNGAGGAEGAANRQLAAKNNEDTIFTAPIFKSGEGKFQKGSLSTASAATGIPDPYEMKTRQQAAVAGAPSPAPAPAQDNSARAGDTQFLRETANRTSQRTGIVGKLPPCTISQGFVIPATFIGGNNSDKPGDFQAMVSQNVYDTVVGNCIVIPAGTMLAGTYSSDIAIGQERLLVAFTRLQLPNGKVVPLQGMQGADPNGSSGVSGDVNNHFWKIFGGALIIGVLEQHFNQTATATSVTPPGTLTTYGNTAGQVAANTAQTMLGRNQNIRPTITTAPGQKLLLRVQHDIVMEPYRD